MKFLNHVSTCQFNTITELKLPHPEKAVLEFKNTGNIHDDRFTIIADFETTNTPILPMCDNCHEKYKEAPSKDKKHEVQLKCSENNHKPNLLLTCTGCNMESLKMKKVVRLECIAKKHEQRKARHSREPRGCKPCERKILKENEKIRHTNECRDGCVECEGRDRCHHSSTTQITRLDPIMFSAIIYDQVLKQGISFLFI
jgi:hypothetical protein